MTRFLSAIFAIAIASATLLPSTGQAGNVEYKIQREELKGLSTSAQRAIGGLQYVLNAYQIRQFLTLESDSTRTIWVDRYWKSNDPTPATEENEMRVEHTIRVNITRQFFKRPEWPGWDKRGEVFIRYGAPNVRVKIPAEVTVRKTHAPGELWYFTRFNMVVIFRDETLTGNYIYAINPLGAAQDMTVELAEYLTYDAADRQLERIIPPEYLEFYRDPEFDPDASPPYSPHDEAMYGPQGQKVIRPRMRGVTERIDEPVDPEIERNAPNNPSTQFIMRQADEMANRFEETLEDTPVAYPFNFEEEEFPFYFDIEQFKAGDDLNRIEVNVEFPVEPAGENEVGDRRIYTATAVFWDADYNEVSRVDREMVLPVQHGDSTQVRLMPLQLVFSLERDYYRMSVTMNEVRRSQAPGDSIAPHVTRESSYRSTVTTRTFKPALTISDILFAQRISPAERQSPFNRGAVEVVPHPIRRYRRGSPVPVYFEVYNLGIDEEGLSNYEIEYRIVPHTGDKKGIQDRFASDAVSSGFQSSGFNADEPLHLTIQSKNIKPGTYDLLITVKDNYWQSVTYRQATFRIVK